MLVGAINGLELGNVRGGTLRTSRSTPPFATSGLTAWLDAADSLVLDDVGRVQAWLDKWSGRSATQSDASRRPYVNAVNGLPCAYMPNGSNAYLDASYLASFLGQGRDPWMLSFVWNVGNQSGNQFAVSMFGSGDGSGLYSGFIGNNLYGERSDGTNVVSTNAVTSAGPMVCSLCYDGTVMTLRKNGAGIAAVTSTNSTHPDTVWIGGDPRDGGTRFIFANFCEMVAYNAFDFPTLQTAENYLSAKWNAVY